MVIGVVGIGTAGLQSIVHLLGHTPDDIKVVSIYDPSIDILGIGESTTTFLPYVLGSVLDFSMVEDAELLDATTKHGVKYSNWGDNDFFTSIYPPYHGMHFNNFKLRKFVLDRCNEKFADRFSEIQGKITNISQDENCVEVTINNEISQFDYLVDCTGYPKDYSDYTVDENMPVNHCLVNMIETPGDWNYTHHYATEHGWMFGIPLQTRQGWGYLFNDNITSVEEATKDIASIFNTKVEELNLREFKFKNYHANTFINNRIAVNGNKALFYEPLEALSGTFYEGIIVEFIDVILDGKDSEHANKKLINSASRYKDFIHFVYAGGSKYDSLFWKTTKKKVDNYLENSVTFKELQRTRAFLSTLVDDRIVQFPVSIDLWNLIDEKMKLEYLNDR